jgi:quercetin dioxygenase-like cupin family protein
VSFPKVLVRGEENGGRVGVVESRMPPGPGPPLHRHDFDEAFYVLEGELTFSLDGTLITCGANEVAFAPGGVPHTLANHGDTAARFLIVFTPAGFEREFARRAARNEGVEPPEWALQEVPEVTRLGPPLTRSG